MMWQIIGAFLYIAIGCIFIGISFTINKNDTLTEDEEEGLASLIVLWPIFLLIFTGAFIAHKLLEKK